MTNIFSFLSASIYASFSPLLGAASSVCTANGQPIDCPSWIGWFAGASMGFFLIFWALVIFMVVTMWKIFVKAGQPGWAAIIPIYSTVILLQIARKPVWWIILLLLPFINIIFSFILVYNLAKVFGKGGGFTLGLVLLPIVFYPILAFGKATYQPTQEMSQPMTPNNPPSQPTNTQM